MYFRNYFEQFFGNFCVFEETFCALFLEIFCSFHKTFSVFSKKDFLYFTKHLCNSGNILCIIKERFCVFQQTNYVF